METLQNSTRETPVLRYLFQRRYFTIQLTRPAKCFHVLGQAQGLNRGRFSIGWSSGFWVGFDRDFHFCARLQANLFPVLSNT